MVGDDKGNRVRDGTIGLLVLVGSAAVTGLLDYSWLSYQERHVGPLGDAGFLVGLGVIALAGSLALRSWWAVVVLAIVMYIGGWTGLWVWCHHHECLPLDATPIADYLRYGLRHIGLIVAVAAVGTLAGRRLFQTRKAGRGRAA